jgi:hypothetical protein
LPFLYLYISVEWSGLTRGGHYAQLACSRKGIQAQRLLLKSTITAFDAIESRRNVPMDRLRNIQGTIIVQISFAVKQDQKLGRE